MTTKDTVSSNLKKRSSARAEQLVRAQNDYRLRMRRNDFQRFQEWFPKETISKLNAICKQRGLTKREAIERMISGVNDGKFELDGVSYDN